MDDTDVDRIVRSALAAGVVEPGSHPDPDTLFRYHARELSAADADAVQGHLAVCRECAQAVLDFGMFPDLDAPSEEDVPTAEELEAGWAEVRARLGTTADDAGARPPVAAGGEAMERAEDAVPAASRGGAEADLPRAKVLPMTPRGGTAPRLVTPPATVVVRAPAWLKSLAAVLAVVALGLGIQLARLRRAADDPVGNVAILLVQPDDAESRGEITPRREKIVDRNAPRVAVVLPYAGDPGAGPFSAEVRFAGGGFDLHRLTVKERRVVLDAARTRLPAGDYRITLLDAAGKVVAEYAFPLTYK